MFKNMKIGKTSATGPSVVKAALTMPLSTSDRPDNNVHQVTDKIVNKSTEALMRAAESR